MLNVLHILHHHFNHADTRPLLGALLPALARQAGPPALRLLRVLCGAFFRPSWYSGARAWIGKGAYAQVCALLCMPTAHCCMPPRPPPSASGLQRSEYI